MNVLDQLGMSLHARTNFIKYVPFAALPPLSPHLTMPPTATICPPFPHTKISRTVFFPRAKSPPPSTSPSPSIAASLQDSSSSSAAYQRTTWACSPGPAKRKRMATTGGRSWDGAKTRRIQNSSGCWRSPCWRSLERRFFLSSCFLFCSVTELEIRRDWSIDSATSQSQHNVVMSMLSQTGIHSPHMVCCVP